MRSFSAVLLILVLCLPVLAQTVPVSTGLYEAESAAGITYTGAWTTITDGDYAVRQSSTVNDGFTLNFEGAAIVLYRDTGFNDISYTHVSDGGSTNIIGSASSLQYRSGQQFIPTVSGQLKTIRYTLSANVGTPTGGISWQIRADSAGLPGALIASGGPNAIIQSVENTVNIAGGPTLTANTKYWMILFTQNQTSGNNYRWRRSNTTNQAGVESASSIDGGTTWTKAANTLAYGITQSAAATIEICLNSSCANYDNASTTTREGVPLAINAVPSGSNTLTVRNLTNAIFRLDSLMILPATVQQTESAWRMEETFVYQGTTYTGYLDLSISSGELAIVILLLSLVVIQLAKLIYSMMRQGK